MCLASNQKRRVQVLLPAPNRALAKWSKASVLHADYPGFESLTPYYFISIIPIKKHQVSKREMAPQEEE